MFQTIVNLYDVVRDDMTDENSYIKDCEKDEFFSTNPYDYLKLIF